MLRPIRDFLAGFRDGRYRIPALEFLLFLPFLAFAYLASAEAAFLRQADRRVATTTATLVDLTTRLDDPSYCEVEAVFDAVRSLIQGANPDSLRMRISAVSTIGGAHRVNWSQGRNIDGYAENEAISMEDGVSPGSGQLIIGEVQYDFESPLAPLFADIRQIDNRFFLSPRRNGSLKRTSEMRRPADCGIAPDSQTRFAKEPGVQARIASATVAPPVNPGLSARPGR